MIAVRNAVVLHQIFPAILWLLAIGLHHPLVADEKEATPKASPAKHEAAKFETVTLRGRVVWLAEALARRYEIKQVPEASERLLALESSTGELHPLVEDIRGRAFRRDERLRGIPLELVVRRYEGSPLVQVIRVFEVRADGKYELDYWCEICSIAMVELKDCDCCQGPIELRRRKVE